MATLKKSKARSKVKSTVRAPISHQYRTRLHAIMGFSELLLNKRAGTINKEQREFLKDIHTSAAELLQLVKADKKKSSAIRGRKHVR